MTQKQKRETHERKVQMLLAFARRHGIREDSVAPLGYRMMWKRGWLTRPPHFRSVWVLATEFALFMFVSLGGATMFVAGAFVAQYPLHFLALCFVGGFAYGGWIRMQARKFGLSSWDSFEFEPVKHHYIR
jgi:hypothetical protein